jgi:copper chaperone CopZ
MAKRWLSSKNCRWFETVTASNHYIKTENNMKRLFLLAATLATMTAASASDTLRVRIDDMHCKKCSDRIITRLQQLEGIDSLAPNLNKHYMFIRYDANRTSKADIRAVINKLGYTPVNYYTSDKISWAYYNIPVEQATKETVDAVLAIDGVEDANVNARRKSLAVTFFSKKLSRDQLLTAIQQAGIKVVVPPPHVCSEEEK